jgi:DNA repair exonuclease SbcCD ATPase subunit
MSDNENLSDDLEKMINEAEMEAQIEDSADNETPSSFEGEPVDTPEVPTEEKKELSKARRIYRRILVWLVVIAIAFAGGFFTDTTLRFQPEKSRNEMLTADLEKSADRIADLESEIERLSLFEETNLALREEINQITTHLTLLGARTTVADAQLAIEQDRLVDAKVSLDKLGTTLESLKTLVNAEQAEVVENLIQRQQLILAELDDGGFPAQTDLEVIATRLSSLENTLFSTP